MSDTPLKPHAEVAALLAKAKLGKDRELIQLQSHIDDACALATLCSQAKHHIHVYCHSMSPLIYDASELIEAIETFALSSSRAKLRLLIQDTQSVSKQCNRLLSLSHRLSSSIDIRKTHDEFIDRLDEFVTIDDIAYFRRPNAEHYLATCCFNAPGTAKELNGFFEPAWEHSQTDLELRNMLM